MNAKTMKRRHGALAATVIAWSLSAFASASLAGDVIEQKPEDLKPCGTYDAAALDPRPIPDSIGGPGLLDLISKNGFKTPATILGAADPMDPTWYNTVKIIYAGAGEGNLREEADRPSTSTGAASLTTSR